MEEISLVPVPAKRLHLEHERVCKCPLSHINCLSAKEWLKAQVAIQSFYYERRDVRDKDIHPAVFPIALPAHFIKLFTHEGELVLDPFVGIGSTLMAARDLNRNAVGFDLKKEYVDYAEKRLAQTALASSTKQIPLCDDSLNIPEYLEPETVSLSVTSPPYANMLNHKRLNKSIRGDMRNNKHYLKVQQYSSHPRDLGQMNHELYAKSLTEIYRGIFPLMKLRGNVIINVNDVWENNRRYPTHIYVIKALEEAGFEFRNTIMWDKRDLVNNVGIFGWPNNFITLGTTMEFILHFWRPS
jgi:DNA modification methylase